MQKHIMVVMINCIEGTDEHFNHWYENFHIRDIMSNPGFVSAQRYRLADEQRGTKRPEHRYLTIYELETDDLPAMYEQMKVRMRNVDRSSTMLGGLNLSFSFIFTPMGEKMIKDPAYQPSVADPAMDVEERVAPRR